MEIVVYSKSGCGQCVFTKKFLNAQNIPFNEKRVDQNKQYLEEVEELGYQSLPVVGIDKEEFFSGYDLKKLQSLVSRWQK